MAELIKNFSGTDVAIWAENEQNYYLGDVTLPPGRYYFVFNKISGTLPSKYGGYIYYSYSAGVAGIDSVGINNYGSTTSGIYEIQSTREGSAYIWSNLSRFDTNGEPPQDERLTYEFSIFRLTDQEIASLEESKRKSASKSRADESAWYSAYMSAENSAWMEQSALMSAEWSAYMSASAHWSASRSASAWLSEHKKSMSASASKSAWQSISRLLSLERSALASADESRRKSSADQSKEDSRLRSSARQSEEDSRRRSSAEKSREDSILRSIEESRRLSSSGWQSIQDMSSSEPEGASSSSVPAYPTDSSIPDHFPSSSGTPQESSSEPEGASSSSVPTYSTDSSIPDHFPSSSTDDGSGDGGSGDGDSGDGGSDDGGTEGGTAEDDCVYYPLAKITIKDGKVFVRQIARYVTPDLRLGAVIRERNENPETEE